MNLQAGGRFAGALELDVHEADSSLKALSTIYPVNEEKHPPPPPKPHGDALEAVIDMVGRYTSSF